VSSRLVAVTVICSLSTTSSSKFTWFAPPPEISTTCAALRNAGSVATTV
jgi:hypothetical protein